MTKNKRFQSVSEMFQDTSKDVELAKAVEDRIQGRQLIKHLIAHRVKVDMSQQDVADHLGCSQSRISKLESSIDDDVRLGDLEDYAKAIGLQFRKVLTPQSQTAVDEIKYHAFRIRCLLRYLVNLVEDDEKIAGGIAKFVCIETPFNLLQMVVDSAKHLPRPVLKQIPGVVIEDECSICECEEYDKQNSETELQPS